MSTLPAFRHIIPDILDLDLTVKYHGPVRISHEAAALLLPEYNKGNRRKRNGLIEYLLRQIRNGEWQSDHPQPIVFSDAARLIDGQHRLFAIAESGVTVIAMIITGVRDQLQEYLDTGISRQLEDRVKFTNDHNDNRRIAQLVNMWSGLVDGVHKRAAKPTPSEAIDIFQKHKTAFAFAQGYMTRRQAGVCAVPVMLALAEMYERNQERAELFVESLMTPDGEIQQARRLREYLVKKSAQHATASGSARQDIYLRSVGAMKAYLDGREIGNLRCATW